jgi:hypothetical protein
MPELRIEATTVHKSVGVINAAILIDGESAGTLQLIIGQGSNDAIRAFRRAGIPFKFPNSVRSDAKRPR